jgi:hypothetical protein
MTTSQFRMFQSHRGSISTQDARQAKSELVAGSVSIPPWFD